MNLLNICLFLAFLGFIYLFLAVYFNFPINNLGFFLILLQSLLLLLTLYNRSLSFGFSIFFFLYVSSFPIAVKFIIILKTLRGKKDGFFHEFSRKVYNFLDISFFNFLYCNKGIFYLSRKGFILLDKLFIPYKTNPTSFLKRIVILPWLSFIVCLVLEFLFAEKIYFSAILLSLTVILNRLFLFSLRILEYSALDCLNYVQTKYFYFNISIFSSLPIFFQRVETYQKFLNSKEKNQEAYTKKLIFLESARNFSSSYFFSKLIKDYFYPKLKSFINFVTFFFVLLLVLVKYRNQHLLLVDFLILNLVFLIYLFSCFDFQFRSLKNLTAILNNQVLVKELVILKKEDCCLQSLLPKNFAFSIIYPTNPKPENFLVFFQKRETIFFLPSNQNKLFKKYFFVLLIFSLWSFCFSIEAASFFYHNFFLLNWLFKTFFVVLNNFLSLFFPMPYLTKLLIKLFFN